MIVGPQSFTLAEFIVWEERQPRKHEFRNGAVYAIAGASDAHNQIVSNPILETGPSVVAGPIDLASLGPIVDVAEIYEDVDLTQASRSEVEPSR